ncbi:nucleotide disphospho-sugar-binding domain-containing protein [Microbispora sp. H13382]|uniref:nucleotide disphospho-sugar-binding domain-containing protein n=1 Tax=Microbispora sp. H13382 TaxID=2729112 RepID=UPI0037CB53A4
MHHGGACTTTTAARAGAPQVMVPQAADRPYWAGRTEPVVLGIGGTRRSGAVDPGPGPREPAGLLTGRRRLTKAARRSRSSRRSLCPAVRNSREATSDRS